MPRQPGLNIRPPSVDDDDEPLDFAALGEIKTTKQIRREYLKRTRVSKEEMKRQLEAARQEDREERDRIRKQEEKEKANNRARTLRERKKAREQQARVELRKQGLPTFKIHPSQSTITWFARGEGNKRKISETEEAEGGEQPPKRTRLSQPEQPSEMAGATVPQLPPSPSPRHLSQALPASHHRSQASPSSLHPTQALPIRETTNMVAGFEPPSVRGSQSLSANVDDFEFPTGSQLERELAEEWAPSKPVSPPAPRPVLKPVFKPVSKPVRTVNQLGKPKPVGTTVEHVTQKLSSLVTGPVAAAARMVNRIKDSFPFFSSQDLVMSTQDIREVEEAPAMKPPKPKPQVTTRMVDRIKDSFSFRSNWDLAMSSQDIREVEGTTAVQPAIITTPHGQQHSTEGGPAPPILSSEGKPRPSNPPPSNQQQNTSQPAIPRSNRPLPHTLPGQLVLSPPKGHVATSLDESDYDDDIFDDDEALDLLEKVESGITTPALIPAVIVTAPVDDAPTTEDLADLIGDGSWVSSGLILTPFESKKATAADGNAGKSTGP